MPYHLNIVKIAKSLNLEFEGLCHGISARWLEACFLDEEDIFLDRIYTIMINADMYSSIIEETKDKKGFFVNPAIPYDILAFIDSLRLYMAENRFFSPLDWPTTLAGHDLSFVSKIAGSDKIQKLGGLSIIDSIPLILNEAEIERALIELGQSIPPGAGPIGLLLNGPHHVMGMTYDEKKGWCFMDINQHSKKTKTSIDTATAAKKIMLGLKEDPSSPFLAFSISLVPDPHHSNTKALAEKFKEWKKKHPITEEMALRKESVNLVYIAAELNDAAALKTLREFQNPKINFNIKSYSKKQTPLTIAVYYGLIPAIKELAQQKVNFNIPGPYGATAALIAAQRGRLNVVQELNSYGVDFDHACTVPIIVLEKIAKENNLTTKMKKFIDLQLAKNKHAKTVSITPYHMATLMNHKEVIAFLTPKLHQNKLKTPSSYYSLVENGSSSLSKIKMLLTNYTDGNSAMNRFFHGHWNHHHVREVEEIIKQIDQRIITSAQEALEILHYIPLVNPKGTLAHHIQFIRNEYGAPQTLQTPTLGRPRI